MKTAINIILSVTLLVFSATLPPCFSAQPVQAQEQQQSDVSTETLPDFQSLKESIEKNISIEKKNIEELNQQLNRLENTREKIASNLNTYQIQISAHGNLLLNSDTRIQDLEEASLTNQATISDVSEKIKGFTQKAQTASQLQHQTEEQFSITQNQLSQLEDQEKPSETKKEIISSLKRLSQLLSTKNKTLLDIQKIYKNLVTKLEETHKSLTDLSAKFDNQIQLRKKEALFKRKSGDLIKIAPEQVIEEISRLNDKFGSLFSMPFWETQISIVWRSSGLYVIMSLLIFALVQLIFYRIGHHFTHLLQQPLLAGCYWRRLTILLIRRSLLLLGTVLFFYTYSQVLNIDSGISLFQLILKFLYIWLFTKWTIDFLKLLNDCDPPRITSNVYIRIRLLIMFIRYFAISYLAIDWFLMGASVILILGQLLFEIILLVWAALFWRLLRKKARPEFLQVEYKGFRYMRTMTPIALYTIAGTGLILDLAGFDSLALFWSISWGKTMIVLLWGLLIKKVIREWDQRVQEMSKATEDTSIKAAYPSQWILIRISSILWALALIIGLLFAWGAKQQVLISIFQVINYPLQIGGMSFSIFNLILACFILVLTHAIARFSRHVVRKKLLDKSALEPGLKDSVTSISIYLVWGIGILISLTAFGLNPTSLAVAFGALGIGLGFGLQNIFNNFISGIILLFERPIQVGDAIEVNGIWGEVRKVNVRSTLVQTYDNASLIIPNSDLISSQVTNWSFKDVRLRRTIEVGVAYGSDTTMVRDTLYDVAEKTRDVLKYPRPQVLFHNFGDSALIFRLRVWTDIDNMLTIESDIRFEIDRLFKEKNIEIAFPQCDLHLRTIDKQNASFHINLDKNREPDIASPDMVSNVTKKPS
jgi:small-conductance mechanosensitive channel